VNPRFRFQSLAILGIAVLSWSCATPVAPTGGPRDTTPPLLLTTNPARNSVEFDSTTITLEFSEKVDEASFQLALSFTPDLPLPPEVDWDGRSVALNLRVPLRDSTTYILTLDKQLKDYRGVNLNQPITVAFSTGPTIDEGMIAGRIAEAASGDGVDGIDVFAYEVPRLDSADTGVWKLLGLPASYRTQTGSDGSFRFENLPNRPFGVVAAEDRNRNRAVDSLENFALPSWGAFVPDTTSGRAARTTSAVAQTLFLARPDTRSPTVTQLQSLSNRRTEIRFSEPVTVDTLSPDEWVLQDTVTSANWRATALYQPVDQPGRIVLVSDPLPAGEYRLTEHGVVRDTASNPAEDLSSSPAFKSRDSEDTLAVRFVRFSPEREATNRVTELGAGMTPEVTLNQFVEDERLAALVSATLRPADTTAAKLETPAISFVTRDGTTWRIRFDPPVVEPDTIRIEVSGVAPADTTYAAEFIFLDDATTGSLTGVVVSDEPVVVELRSVDTPVPMKKTEADSSGHFAFRGLLKGRYILRAFADRNSDGAWTPGSIEPFRLSEPLIWQTENLEVRKGWESAVDTLRFDVYEGGPGGG
jgi:hypothetical protein